MIDKEAIIKSCENHKARLEKGAYNLMYKDGILKPDSETCKICALSAYAIDHDVEYIKGCNYAQMFAKHFDVDEQEIIDFTDGFDGALVAGENDTCQFGKSLHRKYLSGEEK